LIAPFRRRSAVGPIAVAFDLTFDITPTLRCFLIRSLLFKPPFPLTGFDHLPFALVAAEMLLSHANSPFRRLTQGKRPAIAGVPKINEIVSARYI
jgi:hypothetical protein